MAPTYKIALIQLNPEHLSPSSNFARASSFIRTAASQGCSLAVLPEYHLTSWVPGSPRFQSACEEGATYVSKYQALAQELSICIVPGTIIERATTTTTAADINDGDDRSLLNNALFIDSSGHILAKYQKKNLWHPERPHLVSSAHDPHTAFDTPLGRAGLLICWDLAFPEAFRELVADGAQLIIVPAFWTMRDVSTEAYAANPDGEALFINSCVVARAFENTAAVVFCNAGGPAELGEKTGYAGLSQVAVPHVGAVGGAMGRSEGMKIVQVDCGVLEMAEGNYKVREDMKAEGWHYAYTRIREGKL